MKIYDDAYDAILMDMEREYAQGNTYVAFLMDASALHQEDLNYFSTFYDAMEYCYEMSTDRDQYAQLPIKNVLDTLRASHEDKSLLILRDGTVDVLTMVMLRLELQEKINNKNDKVMNEQNFENLKTQIMYSGFGLEKEYDLREKMQGTDEKFTLGHEAQYGKDKVEATLNFKRSDKKDLVFYNSYDLKLDKGNGEKPMQQTFYINNMGQSITLKEAYNLMEGRSVNKNLYNKEEEKYNVWIKLDRGSLDKNGNHELHTYGANYGYSLEDVLKKHPIKELDNETSKKELLDSLKKGNVQIATFIKEGSEVKQYVEANPQFKTIKLYDEQMQPLHSRKLQEEKQDHSQGQENTSKQQNEKAGQEASDEGPGAEKAGKGKDRKRSQSIK
jgi:hypothetical protein